jgi:hypothetical protein
MCDPQCLRQCYAIHHTDNCDQASGQSGMVCRSGVNRKIPTSQTTHTNIAQQAHLSALTFLAAKTLINDAQKLVSCNYGQLLMLNARLCSQPYIG